MNLQIDSLISAGRRAPPDEPTPRLAAGCAALFLTPFCLVGLYSGWNAVTRALAGDWVQAAFMSVFALTFGGAGFGLLAAMVSGAKRLRAESQVRERHPEEPWRWRADWAAGRILDQGKAAAVFFWVFAILWNAVAIPAGYIGLRTFRAEHRPEVLLALLFPVVGTGLLTAAVYQTLRARRFGRSELELSTVPGVIGRTLEGRIRAALPEIPPAGVRIALTCVRRVTSGSGDDRSTRESVLWQDQETVRRATPAPADAWYFPVRFAIPMDAEPSGMDGGSSSVVWRLEAAAELRGIDYKSVFEVPVFRTAASTDPLPADPEDVAPADLSQLSPRSGVIVAESGGGTEVRFGAGRNPGAALGLTVFTLIWTGAIWFMVHLKAPLVFPVVFGLFDLLLLIGALNLWARVTRLSVAPGQITVSSALFGRGREERLTAAEAKAVELKIGMQAGGVPYYDIRVERNSGRPVTLTTMIRSKDDAEQVARLIRQRLGLKRGRARA